jgi:hypothetical protein
MSTNFPIDDDVIFSSENQAVVASRMHRQHVNVAVASAVVSAIVHVLLLIYMIVSPPNLGMSSSRPNQRDDVERERLQVHNVDRESFVEAVRPIARADSANMFAAPPVAEGLDALTPAPGADVKPPSVDVGDIALDGGITEPPISPLADGEWQPRQEIIAVSDTFAPTEVPGLERLAIPDVVRIPSAADVVLPVEPDDMTLEAGRVSIMPPVDAIGAGGRSEGRDVGVPQLPGSADIDAQATGTTDVQAPADAVVISEPTTESPGEKFVEATEDVTAVRPIEALLKAGLEVFYDKSELQYGYFRLAINRIDKDVLPVVPKDILFVQDASASIAEQRLYFCRQALSNIVASVGPNDRFNVVTFNDKAEFCFDDWAQPTAESLTEARRFISRMRSNGETDILASLTPLLSVSRTPGRPVVALLVTDGLATTGSTRSSDIIGEFSKINDGSISVFAMGTMKKANTYLLDLLSYCNRGDSRLTVGGRWGIPEALESLMAELRQPVLSAVSLRFAESARCEVYPWMTMNLYSDRQLYIYGRFPRDMQDFTFQAKGEAADVDCDMIFTMNIADGRVVKDKSIRDTWVRQKIYTLIGAYARTQDPTHLREMDQTAATYRVKVPYRTRF